MRIGDRIRRRYAENRDKRLEKPVTQGDLRKLRRDLDRDIQRSSQPSASQRIGGVVRRTTRSFGDIGRSLNSPYDNRRPRIAQMPTRRRDMGIAGRIDLSAMVDPSLRGQSIGGRNANVGTGKRNRKNRRRFE